MTFVHETRHDSLAAEAAIRIGAALPYINGVTAALPPYDAPTGAAIGPGVAIVQQQTTLQITCFVVLDVAAGLTVHAHTALIRDVVTAIVARVTDLACTVAVVVADVRIQGTHV
jgi:hypothetical protein